MRQPDLYPEDKYNRQWRAISFKVLCLPFLSMIPFALIILKLNLFLSYYSIFFYIPAVVLGIILFLTYPISTKSKIIGLIFYIPFISFLLLIFTILIIVSIVGIYP